jgi:hypothetical protein
LVERGQPAGLEEVEHARLCFGLAARYSGQARGPAPLSAAGVRAAPSLWDAALAARFVSWAERTPGANARELSRTRQGFSAKQ